VLGGTGDGAGPSPKEAKDGNTCPERGTGQHPGELILTPADANDLRDLLARHADPANAGPMRAYLKDRFPFFGVKSPQRMALVRAFIVERGLPRPEDVEHVALRLWDAPERECQYAALDLIERSSKRLPPEAMNWLERLIVTRSWWDTVDSLSSPIVAGLFRRHPELTRPWVDRWRVADDLWLRRTALLFQRVYKRETDAALLFALVEENRSSREFFIQKAIGWALREYSKTDPAAVERFVAATPLAPLSRREALKWVSRGVASPRP
jgi:3-methyladenine DNA glycosylase AlkD